LVRSGTHRVDRRAYRKCKTDDRYSASGEHRGGINLTGLDQPLGFGTDVEAHGRSTLIFKGDQPALHRPPAPQLVKDSSVAHDVVEMLEGE